MSSYEYTFSSSSGNAGNAASNGGYSVEYSSVGGEQQQQQVIVGSSGLSAGAGSAGYSVEYVSGGSVGSGQQSFSSSSGLSSGAVLVGSVASGAASYGGSAVSGGSVSVVSGSGSLEASAFSAIEQAILRANNPVEFNESESLTINGQTGIWVNRSEVLNWRGVIPITQYVINEDSNPEVIRKKTEQQLIYEQEVAIRYLRPPTPPPPGEILIKQEKNIPTPPAPPLVIRQQPPRPETPAPLVIREAPPRAPLPVGQKVITISGKRLPPAPRKVVIERLAPLPSKPQSYIVERWLPYGAQKRRVIFQRNLEADPVVQRPRNVIIQWEAPSVQIKKDFKDLGVIRANPVEYVQRYGASLQSHVDFPQFVREIRPPVGVVLAAEYVAPSLIELEGDVQALNLIDLEREGLAEYRAFLARFGGSSSAVVGGGASFSVGGGSSSVIVGGGSSSSGAALLSSLFSSVDLDASGKVSRGEAEKLLLRLNSSLGRSYGEEDVSAFFKAIDANGDGVIEFEEFKNALLKFL
jgi:hypothetical protein